MDERDLRRKIDALLAYARPGAASDGERANALAKARELALAHGLRLPSDACDASTYASSCSGVPRPRASSVLRCAYCHGDANAVIACPCGALLHAECRAEIGCTTLGCRFRVARARPAPAPPPPPVYARPRDPEPAPAPRGESRGGPNGLNGRGRSIWNR